MQTSPELSIVVPTFNEIDNVDKLVEKLERTLGSIHWEVIFVDDDSPDGTIDKVHKLAKKNNKVRSVLRIKRRGLATAFIEGSLSSSAPYIALMDGDLQHDESIIPQLLNSVKSENYDIAVGSRYINTGGVGDWDKSRVAISQFATKLSNYILKVDVTDPMSGFFVMSRSSFNQVVRNLSSIGYKILLDILCSSEQPLKVKEIPYQFRIRQHGESKLDSQVAWDFIMLIGDKLFGSIVPVRFLSFAIVGAIGVGFHMFILALGLKAFGSSFLTGQTVATLFAVALNFSLNNFLTYRDKRLKGWKWVGGLISFYIVCSLGAFSNIAISTYLHNLGTYWVLAALGGIVIGAVWNYAMSSFYTWKN